MGITAAPIILPIVDGGGTPATSNSYPPDWENSALLGPNIIGSINTGCIGTYNLSVAFISGGVAYITNADPAGSNKAGPTTLGFVTDYTWNTKSIVLTDEAGMGMDDMVTSDVGTSVDLATNQGTMMAGIVGFTVSNTDGMNKSSELIIGNGELLQYMGDFYTTGISYSATDTSGLGFTYTLVNSPGSVNSGTLTFSGSFGEQFTIYSQAGAPTWTATIVGTGW